ncbi:uncharacterized protein LOC108046421 [Drosophila rhopaloa]|uniref:Uncharacterized protein LOC108046421 n=1 Tax=Drosophila rhopaloa TaxID=1041015 RepID=A0A6P4ETR2_DRORH|nr:uncharacterized protein LOC108046421 [Drosophila rhopaloa]
MDGDQIRRSSSDQELEYSRCRRDGVHYATIAEFLASLNINDTKLGSVQGVRTLSLEDYLKTMRFGEKQSGDGSIPFGTRKIRKKTMQDISRKRQKDSNCPNNSKLISQYSEPIWI